MPSKQVQELLAAFAALPVAEREQFQGMLPQYKLFQLTEGHKHDLRVMEAGSAFERREREAKQREVDSRKLAGLAKNAATLNTNQQKQYQLVRDGIDALDAGQINFHAMLNKLGLILELDKKATAQFQGHVIELLEQIKEKLS